MIVPWFACCLKHACVWGNTLLFTLLQEQPLDHLLQDGCQTILYVHFFQKINDILIMLVLRGGTVHFMSLWHHVFCHHWQVDHHY